MAPTTAPTAASVAAAAAAAAATAASQKAQAQADKQKNKQKAGSNVTVLPSPKMTAALDIEGSVPLTCVQVDALAVLKIIKHCRESFPAPVTGQLLGLDVEGTLEVTNCFPFPGSKSDDGEEGAEGTQYQLDMMRCLRDVNVDNNTVGWYQSTLMGAFLNQSLMETQHNYQRSLSNKSVVLIHDVSRSAMGSLSLRAFRLTPAFMEAHREGKFTADSLAKLKITHTNLLEELPVHVKNSHLVSALLHELEDVPAPSPLAGPEATTAVCGALLPNFDNLDLSFDPYLEKNLEVLMETVEEHAAEQGKYQYLQRQAARDKARLQQELEKRREENVLRQAAGQPIIPEDDILAARKSTHDPSRLEGLLISAQIDGYCKQLNQYAGPALSKLFMAGELQK